MVNTCVVVGCHNRSDRGEKKSYHSIPKIIVTQGEQTKILTTRRREAWVSAVGRKEWTPTVHSRICSDHFITGTPSTLYATSHPDWAPSVKMGQSDGSTDQPIKMLDRYARAQARKRHKLSHAEKLMQTEPQQQDTCDSRIVCNFILSGKLENLDKNDSVKCGHSVEKKENPIAPMVRNELQRLVTENIRLKETLNKQTLNQESLENDDEKVKYLTGLPTYLTLITVFKLVEAHIAESGRTILSKFQKMVLVLMKLRLNSPFQDLGYRFSVSKSTASRIFSNVVHVLYHRLKPFIHWPSREELRLTMPMDFRKHFGLKVAVIVDCFEIFIERPSNLLARAETWSNYKHHNTVKYLIGVAPQGVVSFISQGYGGRASDKMITENCGLLNKLLPGDIVLADRGFDIAESVGLMSAEVKIPAFTKGKHQLSPLEVEHTRKIAHVRIHVERVIGLVKNKYTILQNTLPIDYLQSDVNEMPLCDKIVSVCCALSNLSESIVPFD